MVAAYENVNYPVECLSSGRVPHSRADVRLPKSTFTTDRMEEALKTAKEQKEARGLSLYEHGHDLPAGRRRDGGISLKPWENGACWFISR